MEFQKKVADLVLSRLETLDVNCVLAGGAPRDWSFGREATDLDFYFYVPPHTSYHDYEEGYAEVQQSFEKLGFVTEIKFGYYGKLNPNLDVVFNSALDGMKCQFMLMNVPIVADVLVGNFALDICQAWYKNGEIHTTKEFRQSRDHKIIRILNPGYGKYDQYVQKISNKFPDFLLVG